MKDSDKTTWRAQLVFAVQERNDGPLIACTLSEKELDAPFDDGHGSAEGKPFTAWTENWVFFPVCYDGAEWVGSAPRHPCALATEHQGGG